VKSRHVLRLTLLSAVLLQAGLRTGYAQPTPVGPVIQANTTTEGNQFDPSVAADPAGRFAVVWMDECAPDPDSHFPCSNPSPDGDSTGVFGRWFDALGQPASPQVQLNTTAAGRQELPDVTVGADGRFFAVWGSEGRVVGRFFDAAGTPLGGEIVISDQLHNFAPSVAPWPGGGYAVAWRRSPASNPFGQPREVWLRRLDAAGSPVSAEVRADAGGVEIREGPDVVVADDGSLAVAWQTASLGSSEADWRIRARLFTSALAPVGPELLVDNHVIGGWYAYSPVVVARPGGGFLLAWEADNAFGHDIFDRTLDADGAVARLGEIVRVSDGRFNTDVAVVPDPRGGFLAVWSYYDNVNPIYYLDSRRLDAQGVVVGPVDQLGVDTTSTIAQVAAATTPIGFVVAWAGGGDGDGYSVHLRRFVISATGAEVCLFGAGGFGCDLLRDGGADLVLGFGSPPDRPLLGDFDGDGRDDPCVFRSGRFLCDTNRDGSADVDLGFNPGAGDPLLGDVNGDGREDACFHSGRRFLCDTARNGGTAELIVAFGRAAGDVPLLGNLDGDRDDEPCVFRGAQLLCDLAHDGGAPELVLTVVFSGTPLLGDVDGDGRDDLCLAADGVLRCDTAHDGGGAELEIPYDSAGGAPLLGNVDGY
jgi:hypothetical protein